ncbi:MAG: helix-turn-helix domain-containing protein [Omnitrophica WOR_2 bacterium]|jgi:AraC-like DNA-binding protein
MEEPFDIYKLSADQARKLSTIPNDPHVHEFEELLVGIEGELEHLIDFKSDIYRAPYISFVTKGKMHRLQPKLLNGKCSLWVIRFQTDFIPDTSFGLYSLYHGNSNVEIVDNEYFQRMVMLCEMMYNEMKEVEPSLNVVRDLLKALFTMSEVVREKYSEKSELNTQNTTFKNFLTILEENFRRSEAGVEFYAEKLFMSSRNLNLICQNIMKMSISEIIETRRLTEAKNLLVSTGKSISEIGFELGYNEKSCFTSVFKKKNGVTPSKFRAQIKALI